MKTYLSHIARLRCPNCASVQSLWLAETTMGRPLGIAVNRFFTCEGCARKLRMRPRHHPALIFAARLVALAIGIALFVGGFVIALLATASWLLLVLALVCAFFLSQSLGTAFYALHARYAYTLEVVL